MQRIALYETHVVQSGRLVPFAGWEMPIQYASILEEVRAVRSSAGIFDISHMGRLEISRYGAADLLDSVLSASVWPSRGPRSI